MAKNTKTPVMVLQELTVKNCYDPPEYNLIHSVQGTHENEFQYKVFVQKVSATGVGRSKKEAKHEAARLALQLLAEEGIYHPDAKLDAGLLENSQQDSPMKPPINCIPRLMEMCFENKIPTPEFIEISAVGQPHCREFTYECHVASIVTRATAGSKKHAKQIAAKEMINRLVNVIPDIQEQCESQQLQLTETDVEVIKKYSELTSFYDVKINFNVEIADYDKQLKKLLEDKGLNKEQVMAFFSLPESEEVLEQLLNLFDLKFHFNIIQEIPPTVVLEVNCDTPLCTIDTGKNMNEAKQTALKKMFLALKLFLE